MEMVLWGTGRGWRGGENIGDARGSRATWNTASPHRTASGWSWKAGGEPKGLCSYFRSCSFLVFRDRRSQGMARQEHSLHLVSKCLLGTFSGPRVRQSAGNGTVPGAELPEGSELKNYRMPGERTASTKPNQCKDRVCEEAGDRVDGRTEREQGPVQRPHRPKKASAVPLRNGSHGR